MRASRNAKSPEAETPRENADGSQLPDTVQTAITILKRGIKLSKRRKRELLREIAECPDVPAAARLKAIEIDNKMAGDNAPEKHELSGPDPLMRLLLDQGESPIG